MLRLTNTYGPRMRIKDARQTFIGIWMRSLLEGRPFEVWEGHQRRDFTYIDDCVERSCRRPSVPKPWAASSIWGKRSCYATELADSPVEANAGGTYTLRDFPADRKAIDIGDYFADDALIRKILQASRSSASSGTAAVAGVLSKTIETLPMSRE